MGKRAYMSKNYTLLIDNKQNNLELVLCCPSLYRIAGKFGRVKLWRIHPF